MALRENKEVAESGAENLDYVTERGKPAPSLNHGIVQANLISSIGVRFKNRYRVVSELSLDLSDWPSVPDISLYPKMPLDLHNDVTAMTVSPNFSKV